MKLLAIDLSTDTCSVAVHAAGRFHARSEPGRKPSRLVLQMAQDLVAEAGLEVKDIEAVAFGRGPGAFTGLRIAAGVAQGLAFGLERPVLGISSLQALAQEAHRQHGVGSVAAMLDARMDEVYLGSYALDENGLMQPLDEEALLPPSACRLPQPAPEMLAGPGWSAYPELGELVAANTCDDGLRPTALAIATLALPRLAAGDGDTADTAIPVYLRDKVAW